jgi:hypothetical protein
MEQSSKGKLFACFNSKDIHAIIDSSSNTNRWVSKTNKATANDYEGTIVLFGLTFWFKLFQNSYGYITTMDFENDSQIVLPKEIL